MSGTSIDRDLIRSIISLMLASVLLASATVLLSLGIDRFLSEHSGWPVIQQERQQAPQPSKRQPVQLNLDSDPIDANLRKLWEALKEEEAASQLKFPIGVEEGMSAPTMAPEAVQARY